MGLWETLDYACAALCEAGYPDPWSWTPRQIFHRLSVHRQLQNAETLRQLDVAVLGARGEEKAIKDLRGKLTGSHANEPAQPTQETRPASKAVAERLEEQHKTLPWMSR